MPGTTKENQNGSSPVAETDEDLDTLDPEELKTRLRETQAKLKEKDSQIGRQNQVHGDRKRNWEQERQEMQRQVEAALQQAEAKKAKAQRDADYEAATPLEKARIEAREARDLAQSLVQERDQREQQAFETSEIQDVLDTAEREGIDFDLIDTRSAFYARASLIAARRNKEIEDLKQTVGTLQRALQGEVEEVVAERTGRTQVAAGNPPVIADPKGAKDTQEMKELRAKLKTTKRFSERFPLLQRAAQLGMRV